MDNILFILRALLESLPYIFIQFSSFRGRTRLPFSLCVILSTALMMLSSVGLMWGYNAGIIPQGMLLPFRFIQLFVLLVIDFLLVKSDIFKILFTFFAVFPTMSAVSAISRFIAQYLEDDISSQLLMLVIVQGLVTALMFFPILILWHYFVVKPLGTEKETFWRTAFIIPLAITVVNLLSMENGGIAIEISAFKLLERLAFFGCIVACSASTVHIRQNIERQTELEERSKRDRLLLDVQKQQYDTLVKYLEESRAARHDFKHHIVALRSMCEQKEYDKLSAYLNETKLTASQEIGVSVSPNRTVNAIIDYYIEKMKDADITLKMDMHIGERYGVSDSDLCVLLGNILENAIEGCLTVEKEKRFVRICSSEHAGRLYLTFDNSFDGNYKTNGSNLALSRKRGYSRSGVGMQSIRAVVEKYGGMMNVETRDNVFCLSVTLLKNA